MPDIGTLQLPAATDRKPMVFGVTLQPSFVTTADPALDHPYEHLHGWLGTIFYGVIGLHILAALWHHFYRRDNTLTRMT